MQEIIIAPTRQARTAMTSACAPPYGRSRFPAMAMAVVLLTGGGGGGWGGAGTGVGVGAGGAFAAQPVQGIATALRRPVAVRGGVLMLSLTASTPGDHWPSTIQLTLADGRTIDGTVAWMAPAPQRPARNWTDDPRGLTIRPVSAGDDTSAASIAPPLGPYLLARLPADAGGPIRFQQQTLDPAWTDRPAPPASPPSTAAAGERQSALQISGAEDRPDPHSPFEYWRWTLLAEDLALSPPPRDGYSPSGSLLAEHYADLWHIGLARLAARDPDKAARCRSLLTQTADDRSLTVATWVSDPAQLSALLELLLQADTDPSMFIRRVEEWIESIDPIIIWPQREDGEKVRLAIANTSSESIVVKFSWPGLDEIPLAAEIGPRIVRSVNVDRAPLPAASPGLPAPAEPAQQGLLIQAQGRSYGLSFGPRSRAAAPPGVAVGPLHPMLTLAEARARRAAPVPPDHATLVSVRRRWGRWEVLFECRRPTTDRTSDPSAVQGRLDDCMAWHATAGTEAITILLGEQDNVTNQSDMVILTVTETGPYRQFRGPAVSSLEIHRRSWADRWYCRLVLPDVWLSARRDRPTLMGFARTHGDNLMIDVGPGVSVPWKIDTGPLAIDLTEWRDLP